MCVVCAQVRFVVLDEADQMLDMGFQEDMEVILQQVSRGKGLAVGLLCKSSAQGRQCYQSQAVDNSGGGLPQQSAQLRMPRRQLEAPAFRRSQCGVQLLLHHFVRGLGVQCWGMLCFVLKAWLCCCAVFVTDAC